MLWSKSSALSLKWQKMCISLRKVVFNNTSRRRGLDVKNAQQESVQPGSRRLSRSELGHGLGAFRHSVLGQLAGEDEADGSLDLPGGDGWLLVHTRQLQ